MTKPEHIKAYLAAQQRLIAAMDHLRLVIERARRDGIPQSELLLLQAAMRRRAKAAEGGAG